MADENTVNDNVQADAMAAVDAVLEPLRRMAASPQPMNTAQLGTVASCVRQALAIVVYGPPPVHETVVEDPNAVAADSLVPGSSEPQFPGNDEAPGSVEPDVETDNQLGEPTEPAA